MDEQQHVLSDKELFQEIVWDKLQTGEYRESNGQIYDYESGELICSMGDLV